MKCNEFRRWLQAQGAEFRAAKGSDFKVYLNGKATIFADHGSKEMHEGLRNRSSSSSALRIDVELLHCR